MATSVTWNGVVYSIPNVGDEDWGENLTSYFVALPQGALQKTGGAFTLTADANFGASFGLLSRYFTTRTAVPSTAGLVRLAVSDSIGWRNNANGGNLLLAVNASDQLTFNGTAIYPAGITALTGDVTATGPGSSAATISAGVIINTMVSGSAAIAYSKLNLATSILNSDISGSAAIAFSKLAALSSGNILVGSSGNVATSVSVTGDVTISNLGVTAIGANKVTLSMMAQMATASFLGRNTASTGNVEVLSATTATAILNAMVGDSGSGGTKGLVPAPAAGDAAAGRFLKADGTWEAPAGIGTVTSVAMTVPTALFAASPVPGSPVTSAGTLAPTLATQTARTFFQGPQSGSAATPTFAALASPTVQRFTSGSGTYTAPSSPVPIYIEVTVSGGGGGGGIIGGPDGGTGGTSTFGSVISCTGGSGGSEGGGGGPTTNGSGGLGGTPTLVPSATELTVVSLSGGSGAAGSGYNAAGIAAGGSGGSNPFGGAGGGQPTTSGISNGVSGSGAGGGGATGVSPVASSGGGGAGAYAQMIIKGLSGGSTFSYSVGAGGTSSGSAGDGGLGGSGIIIVKEYYQ